MINQLIQRLCKGLPFLLFGFCLSGLSACYKTAPTSPAAGSPTALAQPLASILANNPGFHSFDTLLQKSGLYQQVTAGDSSYTLLIPDDVAFAASGLSVDSLLNLSADSLRAFVGYHILAGSYPTSVIPQTITNPYTTLSGQTLYFSKPLPIVISFDAQTIAQGSRTLNVNGITTKKVDIPATNGVVQILSLPLVLPYPSVQAYLSRPEYSYLAAALKKFNLWDELASKGPYTVFAPDDDVFEYNGVTMDMINSDTFDIRHYEPFLFSAGILPGRIFLTDFTDAPLANGVPTTAYSSYGSVQFNNVSSTYNPPPTISAFDWSPGPFGGFNQIGGYPGYTVTNQPAVNGVVHGINDLLVYPYYVHLPLVQ